ncbi:MAG: sugar transferase [Candidatus Dormibacteria bacterium]
MLEMGGQAMSGALDSAPAAPRVVGGLEDTGLRRSQDAYLLVRRPVEVLLSLAVLLIALPVLAVCAVAIALDSPGGVLFRQERVGEGGRLFTILKLRSMVVTAPVYSSKIGADDPRITRVGRLLRLSGLDELPQLVNVIRGDLSLVGPRPEMKFIVDGYEPWQRRRHLVRPGITGWWQIHHRTGDPMHLRTQDDLHYIRHLGPLLDLRIALMTPVVMLRGALLALTSKRRKPTG